MKVLPLQGCGSIIVFAITALTPVLSAHAIDSAGAIVAPAQQRSPLIVGSESLASARGPILALEMDDAALAELRNRQAIHLTDFVLPGSTRNEQPRIVELELSRMNVITPETRFVVGDPHAPGGIKRELPPPVVDIFSGRVAGEPGSRVFLSVTPNAQYGFILIDGRTILLSSAPQGVDAPTVIYDMNAIPPGLIKWRDFLCGAGLENMPAPQGALDGGVSFPDFGDTPPCRRIEKAIETDYEYTNDLFGGNLEDAAAYVATLLGASSEIFTNAINAELEVGFVRLWDEPDPWTGNSTSAQLFEFRDYWNANMTHVERHLAHFLSGRELGGGVAWLNAVCHSSNAYALSANLNGTFPYPIQDFSSQNWDLLVVTHEIGHNFGTPHTHDYCPPLDECPPEQFWGNCQSQTLCVPGTIMGYCHLCDGGIGNVAMEFHPVVKQTMLNFLDTVTNCYIGCAPQAEIVHVPDDVPTISEALLTVLDGGQVIVASGTYNETLTLGAKQVHLLSSDGPESTIIDATGTDTGVLRVLNAGSSDITIEGFTFTNGVGTPATIGGTGYVLGGGAYVFQSNPTFINCTFTNNSAQFGGGVFNRESNATYIDCTFEGNSSTSSGGGMFNFSGSQPLLDNCTFLSNSANANGGAISNQGSSPTVFGSSFINNAAADSGGAIRNIQGSAPTFENCSFESNTAANTGGAFFNEDSSGTSIAASMFCENDPNTITGTYTDAGGNEFNDVCEEQPSECVGDLTGNGEVDVFDLIELINAWGSCADPDECPADLNDDGEVDVFDLILLINAWGPCPD